MCLMTDPGRDSRICVGLGENDLNEWLSVLMDDLFRPLHQENPFVFGRWWWGCGGVREFSLPVLQVA